MTDVRPGVRIWRRVGLFGIIILIIILGDWPEDGDL